MGYLQIHFPPAESRANSEPLGVPFEQLPIQALALVRALGRCIAADPVAIDDLDLAVVERCGRSRVHLPVWQADSAGMWHLQPYPLNAGLHRI